MWLAAGRSWRQTVNIFVQRHFVPQHRHQRTVSSHLCISDEVAAGLHGNRPVVALESTIITHGMPYPDNIQTARMVEKVVRENGAIPATIAILRGRIHIGLTDDELSSLAQTDTDAIKTSRRDLPYVISQKRTGGTTVSGTMIAAHQAGIPVFVTGGIGGVHRGAETTMDVSADLNELGRTPIAVVSAGVKSILDIGRTLEYLETEGVCVATFGETRDFPAFFTPQSGFQAPYNVTSAREAAEMINTSLMLRLGSGLLFAVPVPDEEAAAAELIEKAITMAVQEAEDAGIVGKDLTPYILSRVNQLTSGESLAANMSLIRNNARVGSLIACELAKIRQYLPEGHQQEIGHGGVDLRGQRSPIKSSHSVAAETVKKTELKKQPVVIGGMNIDFTSRFKVSNPKPNGATYPGDVQQSFGGVGHNISSCLGCFGANPLFLSALGTDAYADFFCHQNDHMDLRAIRRSQVYPSAVYCAVIRDNGELIYGLGDFKVHTQITKEYVSSHEASLATSALVCCDGNLPVETIAYLSDICHHNQVAVWFEPTDLHHATKPALCGADRKITYMSPNMNELRAISGHLRGTPFTMDKASDQDGEKDATIAEALELVRPLLEKTPNILVTMGKHGAMFCRQEEGKAFYCPARPYNMSPPDIASVSGAGDCMAAAFIDGVITNRDFRVCLKAGILASQHSLLSHHAVPVSMTTDIISDSAIEKLDQWTIEEYNL